MKINTENAIEEVSPISNDLINLFSKYHSGRFISLNSSNYRQLISQVIYYSSFDYMKNKYDDDERRKFEPQYIQDMTDQVVRDRMLTQFDSNSSLELVQKDQINVWRIWMFDEQSQRITYVMNWQLVDLNRRSFQL